MVRRDEKVIKDRVSRTTSSICSLYSWFSLQFQGWRNTYNPLTRLSLIYSYHRYYVQLLQKTRDIYFNNRLRMGIPVLIGKAKIDFESSTTITAPLAAIIITQDHNIPSKTEIKQIRNKRSQQVNAIKREQQELLETHLDNQSKCVSSLKIVKEEHQVG